MPLTGNRRFSGGGLGTVGVALLAAGWLAGCATPSARSPIGLTGDPLADGERLMAQGPPRDRVLWQYRTALAALVRGAFAPARQYLDDALRAIEGMVGSQDPSARKSRGYFAKEARKTFLGEPYERAMAYYYRGMLYWRDGELDNARACFRSGQVHDADADNRSYASDYVLLDYLEALATAKLGEDAAPAYQRATNSARIAIPPPLDPGANVLFFIEYGSGPGKFAGGAYGEELHFRPGSSIAREAVIRVGRQRHRVGPYDDLTFQATTRGGRVMDHVLANKAIFKGTTSAVGDGAIISGAILAGRRDTQEAGLGVLAFGVLSKIVSAGATPDADTRAWDNLPQYLTFRGVRLPAGEHSATVEFLDQSGTVLTNFSKTMVIQVTAPERDQVVFVSDRSVSPQTL